MRYPNSIDLVEALAASKAISFAKELIIHQMVVEGDSLRFIQAINDASQYGLCMDMLLMILEFFSSTICCSFLHVKRKGDN